MHPRLVRPTVFITSPSDVGAERDIAIQTVKLVTSRHPNQPDVFDWRSHFFSSGRSYQDHIPTLCDPNCWVTICIFGERLGDPVDPCLEELRMRGKLPDHMLSRPLTIDLDDASRTPLTGSVYEYLEASRGEQQGFGHVLVYFKGPSESLRNPLLDLRHRGFGNNALMEKTAREHGVGQFALLPQLIQDSYWRQVKALARFHDAFLQNKKCKTFVTTEELKLLLQKDLRDLFGFGQPKERQLFKALSSFTASDHNAFFGRHDEVAEIVARMEQTEQSGNDTILFIKGKSGSGKSSLAKAGVAGGLSAMGSTKQRRYVAVDATTRRLDRRQWPPFVELGLRIALAARPRRGPARDFQRDPNLTLQKRLHELHMTLVREIKCHGQNWQPQSLTDRLLHHFDAEAKLTNRKIVPVVVFDQFEPMLDHQFSEFDFTTRWQPVLLMLDEFARTRRGWILVPFAFQASLKYRQGLDFAAKLLDRFASLRARDRQVPPTYIVESPRADRIELIVTQPFQCIGHPLSDEVVVRLTEEIETIRARGDGSLLPLIGLVLHWINQRLKSYNNESAEKTNAPKGGSTDTGNNSLDDVAQAEQRHHAALRAKPISFAEIGNDVSLTEAMRYQGERALSAFEAQKFGRMLASDKTLVRLATRDVLDRLLERLTKPCRNDSGDSTSDPFVFPLLTPGIDHPRSKVPADEQVLAQALLEARLLARVSTNSVCLVHDYVLQVWEPAMDWRARRERLELVRETTLQYLAGRSVAGISPVLETDQIVEIEQLLTITDSGPDRGFYIQALSTHFRHTSQSAELIERFEAACSARCEELAHSYLDNRINSGGSPRFDLDAKSLKGFRSPLIVLAAQAGLGSIVVRLIAEGAKPGRGDSTSRTLFHALAATGEHAALETICTRLESALLRSFVNARTQPLGWSPLHAAAHAGANASQTIAVLKRFGANTLAATSDNRMPVHFAAETASTEALTAFLVERVEEQLTAEDGAMRTPLVSAVCGRQAGSVEIICRVLGADPGSRSKAVSIKAGANEAFRSAVASGEIRLLRPLVALFEHLGMSFPVSANGSSPLHRAVEFGYLEIVEYLIEHGANLDELNGNDETAVIIATRNGRADLVALLVNADADISSGSKLQHQHVANISPMHHAVYFNYGEIVDILLARPENADLVDDKKFTPLHLAAMLGYSDIAARLISRAKPNAKTDAERTPLHLAARYGHTETVEVLLRQPGIDLTLTNAYGQTALHLAAYHGHAGVLRHLTSRMSPQEISAIDEPRDAPSLDTTTAAGSGQKRRRPRSALQVAIYAGQIEAVGVLLDAISGGESLEFSEQSMFDAILAAADLRDEDGNSLLHSAALAGQVQVVKSLLARIPSSKLPQVIDAVDNKGRTPLFAAILRKGLATDVIGRDDEQTIDILLDRGAKPDHSDNTKVTPLHLAASLGLEQVIANLARRLSGIRLSQFLNARSKPHGRTALFEAAANNSSPAVAILVELGADPSKANRPEGRTALHAAAFCGNLESAKAIITYGDGKWKSLVNAIDCFAKTPLHCVAESPRSSAEMIRMFLACGADLLARNRADDGTPLHSAAARGNANAIPPLLEAGIDIDNRAGRSTSLTIAAWCGHLAAVESLIAAGADVNARGRQGSTALLNAVLNVSRDDEPTNSEKNNKRACIVELLLAHGADPSIPYMRDEFDIHNPQQELQFNCWRGDTAAHLAIRLRVSPIIHAFLNHEACLSLKGPRETTLLHYAAKFAQPSIVDRLLKLGLDPNEQDADGRTPLHFSAYVNSENAVDCTRLLLDGGAHALAFDRTKSTPMHYAALRGHPISFRLLMKSRPIAAQTVDDQGRSPIHVCVELRQEAKPLIALNGISLATDTLNDQDQPVLNSAVIMHSIGRPRNHLASAEERDAILRATASLSGAKKAADPNGRRALHQAVLLSNSNTVRLLLESASVREINRGDRRGRKPLHLACLTGQSPIARLLLAGGADPQARDADLSTPLHLAAQTGAVDVVDLLLDSCALADPVDKDKVTPLHRACAANSRACISLLLNGDADPFKLTNANETAFHFAAYNDAADAIELLMEAIAIEHGQERLMALLFVRNRNGDTPIRCAEIGGHLQAVAALARHQPEL